MISVTSDISRSTAGLSAEKVQTMIAELQKKIEIETKMKAGAENYLLAAQSNIPREIYADMESKSKIANAKIRLLNKALNKYKGIDTTAESGTNDFPPQSKSQSNSFNNLPVLGRALRFTGRLNMKIFGARDIRDRQNSKSDCYIMINLDGVNRHRTKNRSKLDFGQKFQIKLENNKELELELYDSNGGILGICFFRFQDLCEKGAIEDWFDMEPFGQILLSFDLHASSEKQPATAKGKGKVQKPLTRNVAIRKKKHLINGHNFLSRQFYDITKCSFCSEVILNGAGYQCSCKCIPLRFGVS